MLFRACIHASAIVHLFFNLRFDCVQRAQETAAFRVEMPVVSHSARGAIWVALK